MGQRILVFDEPLANLDAEGAHMLLGLLRQLAKEQHYAVLFVEHRLDVVLPYVDRVLWMEDGRIREIPKNEQKIMQGAAAWRTQDLSNSTRIRSRACRRSTSPSPPEAVRF